MTPRKRINVLSVLASFGASLLHLSSGNLYAQSTPEKDPPTDESIIELSPFVVESSRDRGYASTNTLSGTRTNEELKNLPNAIAVLNQQFIQDIAANDMFDAMQYMPSIEAVQGGAGGIGGNSGVAVNVRGITNNWQSRNGFQWYVPVDSFNTERFEANLGASGQLYGDVGAGGIFNSSTKVAHFTKQKSVQLRFDDWGQRRASVDLGGQFDEVWAARMNGVSSRGGDWRDGPHNDIDAVALANTFVFGRNDKLRLDGEVGRIRNRVGHNLLVDGFSDYVVVSPGTIANDVYPLTPGVQQQYTITADNALGVSSVYNTTGFVQTAGNNQAWRYFGGQLFSLESTGTAAAPVNAFRQTVVDSTRAVNVSESLVSRVEQWSGPDNTADRDYHTVTALYTHRFSSDLWVELGYNLQDQTNTTWQSGVAQVRLDPNPSLSAPGAISGATTVANSYFNELYVEHAWDGSEVRNRVHNLRAIGVYDWKPTEWMSQRIVGTLSIRDEEFSATGMIETLSSSYVSSLGLTGAAAQYGNNRVTRRFYLRDGNSDLALARSTLPNVEVKAVSSAFNARQFQSLSTAAANAFGSYWNGKLRSSIGVRRDLWEREVIPVSGDPVTGEVVYTGPKQLTQRLWNTSLNAGFVYNIVPWLAGVANYSETFIPNATGYLFDGSEITPQMGDGYDLGLRFSLWEDRLNARMTYFYAKSTDAFVAGIVTGNTTNPNSVLYEIVNALGATNTETGRPFTANGANGRDFQDRESNGFEFEATANPSKDWTLRGVLTVTETLNLNRAQQLNSVFLRMVDVVSEGAVGTISGLPLSSASYQLTALRIAELTDEEASVVWRPQINTRYAFSGGLLRGLFIGGSVLWNDAQEIADVYSVATPTTPSVLLREGYTVDSYSICNLFVGFGGRVKNAKFQVQLNVNNVFDADIRLGGYTNGRYVSPRQFVCTTTFLF